MVDRDLRLDIILLFEAGRVTVEDRRPVGAVVVVAAANGLVLVGLIGCVGADIINVTHYSWLGLCRLCMRQIVANN